MTRIFALPALITALATPIAATAGTPGFVDIRLSNTDISASGASIDMDSITVGGSVVTPLTGNWHAQFDAEASRDYVLGDNLSDSALSSHVFYDGGDWAVGGLAGYRSFSTASSYVLGIEGQATLGTVVLEAGIGFGTTESASLDFATRAFDASATWYATPDLSVAARFDNYNINSLGDFIWNNYDLTAEYRFEGSPVSVFGGYAYTEYDTPLSYLEFDTWSLGVRYAFGDGSLQQRRAEGPRWLRESTLSILD